MRITVIGVDDGALADALALARHHEVVITGTDRARIDALARGDWPLADPVLASYLAEYAPRTRAVHDAAQALEGTGLILVSGSGAVRAARSAETDATAIADAVRLAHRHCPGTPVVIRADTPIGFTARLREELGADQIACAPAFRRDGHLLDDTLSPDLLLIGARGRLGAWIGGVLRDGTFGGTETPLRCMDATEAEAAKHFAQVFLAARLAYFNELDSYALAHGLDARQIIDGVSLDPRIGRQSNNPCLGFGGSRLLESTQHLAKALADMPAQLVPMITHARKARVTALADQILARRPDRVGLYRTGAPSGAFTTGDPLELLGDRLKQAGIPVRVLTGETDAATVRDSCDIVVAQRMVPELNALQGKLFCRDLYAQR